MSDIFVSYRRADSENIAGRLHDRLEHEFSDARVFFDIDDIELGVDFVDELNDKLSSCTVLIAVIGPTWVTLKGHGETPRIMDPNDFVRLEVAEALRRNIRVIPVLVDGAAMPSASDLPEDLAPLARRNALELRHQSFKWDMARLVEGLNKLLNPKEDKPKAPRKSVPVATVVGQPWIVRRENGSPAPRRAVTPEMIEECVTTWFDPDQVGCFFAPNIPASKIQKLMPQYAGAVKNPEDVLALHDSTVFGGAKDGYIFTSTGFGFKNFTEDPLFLTYSNLKPEDVVKSAEPKLQLAVNGKVLAILEDQVASAERGLRSVLYASETEINFLNMYSVFTMETSDGLVISLNSFAEAMNTAGIPVDAEAWQASWLGSLEGLLQQSWCAGVLDVYGQFGMCGEFISPFLVRIVPAEPEVDEWIWVVWGHVPDAYISTRTATTPLQAAESYIGMLRDWGNAVVAGKSVRDLAPLALTATDDAARQVLEIAEHLEAEGLPEWRAMEG